LKSPTKPRRWLESSFDPWVGAAAAGILPGPVATAREEVAGLEDAGEEGAWPVPSNTSNGLVSPDEGAPACGLAARASEALDWTGSVGTVGTKNLLDGAGLQPLEQVLGHSGQEGTL